ncbi:DUF6223 family protein [Nocardia tengchongensis]|uniref:DUF6223 family protein n=1 Tax=Nocardia tengchongensis TaxID=2055889 RepID=UPI0036C34463
MSVRHISAAIAAILLGGIALAAPAVASVQQSAAVTGITSGRVGPAVTALVGLVGVVIGSLALAGVGRLATGDGRRGATVALIAGMISLVLGSVFAATAAGGPGTGNGIVGSWAAMVFGLIGVILAGLTLNRARRAGTSKSGME